jgi:NAD(P)H-flavin reductase
MMSMARYLTETGWSGKVHLILGFRAPRDFIFREELAELEPATLISASLSP